MDGFSVIIRIIKILFHFIIGLILLSLLPFIWWVTLRLIGHINDQHLWMPMAVGVLPGIILAKWSLKDGAGPHIWEHELTHAVAAIMMGQIPTRISVEAGEGGECEHAGCIPLPLVPLLPFAIDFITLAPYILPTTTVIVVLLRPLIAPHGGWFDVLIGATFTFHCLTTLHELIGNWGAEQFISVGGDITNTDIGKSGCLFSAIYIPVVTLAIHSILLAIIVHGYVGVPQWGVAVWKPFWSSAVHWWYAALAMI